MGVTIRLNKPLVSVVAPLTALQVFKSVECSAIQLVNVSGHCNMSPLLVAEIDSHFCANRKLSPERNLCPVWAFPGTYGLMIAPDGELLRRYAEERSEEAFADLVRRHVDLVYSAALRQVNGDAHLAQDVAQMVFTELSRRAAPLSRRAVLTGWLFTRAHFCAAKPVRSERCRHSRE